MALRIGIDLDGVLADMSAALDDHATRLFGPAPSTPAPEPAADAEPSVAPGPETDKPPLQLKRRLTERQHRLLWRHVRRIDGFWEQLDETEAGIVARLAKLASTRRWEIIFLTKRPATAGLTSQVQSQRWLAAKGFELPSVYVVTGSRGLIAAALSLDVVVDDRPENCIDIATDSKARVIAVVRPTEPPPMFLKSTGIDVAASGDEWLKRLVELDESLNEQPGPMERLMRKFGLQRAATS
ncbi:MAG: hypothetical protein HOP16_11440 [Acidobacteria bacterium]|nr:hypothetical protein [Acidobacteriota bacterium]